MAKAKRKHREKVQPVSENAPTPERQAISPFLRAGMAYRAIPPIDVMASGPKPTLSQRQHKALSHYRELVIACERSPIKDSCDMTPRAGGGDGPSNSLLRSQSQLRWLEQELGQLQPIALFVAGQDNSLAQWAIITHGARAVPDGRSPEPTRTGALLSLADIRMAGERLAAAIAA
jgi:hypothetical protein